MACTVAVGSFKVPASVADQCAAPSVSRRLEGTVTMLSHKMLYFPTNFP